MERRIDPPSSLVGMTADSLRDKAEREVLVLAHDAGRLVGCGFGAVEGEALYLSKLAVRAEVQRRGVLRAMIAVFEHEAAVRGLAALSLRTRVELAETHRAFEALGFVRTGGTSHPGYDRVTSWSYRKDL